MTGTQHPEVPAEFQKMFVMVVEREDRILDPDLNALLPEVEIIPPRRRLKEAD